MHLSETTESLSLRDNDPIPINEPTMAKVLKKKAMSLVPLENGDLEVRARKVIP